MVRACTWGRSGTPSATACPHSSSSSRQRSGCGVDLGEHERHRAAGLGGQPAHPVHLERGGRQVLAERAGGGQLEDAGAELAEDTADAEELVLGGEGAGHRFAVDGPVGEGAGGREPERAGEHAFAHDLGHALDVVGRSPARCGHHARP